MGPMFNFLILLFLLLIMIEKRTRKCDRQRLLDRSGWKIGGCFTWRVSLGKSEYSTINTCTEK